MQRSRGIVGILLGLAAGLAFGAGGAIVKPLLESGWSPGAAVFFRVSVAALILLVPGLMALKFDLRPLWRAKWTVLVYSVIAVAGVQLAFYTAHRPHPGEHRAAHRVPGAGRARGVRVGAQPPGAAARGPRRLGRRDRGTRARDRAGRRRPRPLRRRHRGRRDARRRGRTTCWASVPTSACRRSRSPRSDASSARVVLGPVAGLTGLVPFEAEFVDVAFFGGTAPWWVPVLMVGAISTAFAYVAGIQSIRLLGTRLSSFLGLSEVVFAAIVSWALLGEAIGVVQLLGGLLILGGIVLVRLERARRTGGDRSRSTSCRCPSRPQRRPRCPPPRLPAPDAS